MKDWKGISFPMLIIMVILTVSLMKEFDFGTLRFRHLPLALVYLLALGIGSVMVFRGWKNGTGQRD